MNFQRGRQREEPSHQRHENGAPDRAAMREREHEAAFMLARLMAAPGPETAWS